MVLFGGGRDKGTTLLCLWGRGEESDHHKAVCLTMTHKKGQPICRLAPMRVIDSQPLPRAAGRDRGAARTRRISTRHRGDRGLRDLWPASPTNPVAKKANPRHDYGTQPGHQGLGRLRESWTHVRCRRASSASFVRPRSARAARTPYALGDRSRMWTGRSSLGEDRPTTER